MKAATAGPGHSTLGKQHLGIRETRNLYQLLEFFGFPRPAFPAGLPRAAARSWEIPSTFHSLSSVVQDQEADGNCLEHQEQGFTPRTAESRVGRKKGRPGKRQGKPP